MKIMTTHNNKCALAPADFAVCANRSFAKMKKKRKTTDQLLLPFHLTNKPRNAYEQTEMKTKKKCKYIRS